MNNIYSHEGDRHEDERVVSTEKVNNILLVEDDRMVSSLIKSSLNKSGFSVHQVYRGDQVMEAIAKTHPDILVLDIGLPGLNGFQICEEARKTFKGPILVLTATSTEDQQVLAFNLGADDYVIKPVSHSILRVRIEALLRRQPTQNALEVKHHFHVGDVDLYPQANKCQINHKTIHLSSFEFKLLSLMMRNEGRVMSRDSMYNLLLGRDYNGVERTIDVRISKLREKLTSEGMTKTKIETVWGVGYILNGEMAS